MVKPLATAGSTRVLGESVEARLRRSILVGELPSGSRLPPERVLATTLGTNRNTLREALRTLESQGLVRAHQGAGTVVVDWRREGDLSLLLHFLLEPTPLDERYQALLTLLALRNRLLEETVALAAERATAAQLAACDEALAQLAAARPGAEMVRADVELFRRLSHAAGSVVSTWVGNAFSRIFAALGERFPEPFNNDAAYLERLRTLLGHIRRRDAESARRILRRIFADRDDFALAELERVFLGGRRGARR
jgi:DNA-binding FadR family transcriptional regulator